MEKLKHDGGIDIVNWNYASNMGVFHLLQNSGNMYRRKLKTYTKTTIGQHHQLPEYPTLMALYLVYRVLFRTLGADSQNARVQSLWYDNNSQL